MKTTTVKSFSQFVDAVFRINQDWARDFGGDSYFWYRGDRNGSNNLLPGAYWRKRYSENDPYIDFKQGAPAYLDKEPHDSWDWYFLAQHWGIPTRLLDWTESPLSALYFAIYGWDGSTTPAVWYISPRDFNEFSTGYPYIIVPKETYFSSLYLPENIERRPRKWKSPKTNRVFTNEFPLAIYPRRANRRIAAQRGTFTVHGVRHKSINKLVEEQAEYPDGLLGKIELKGLTVNVAQRRLATLGIRHSTLFPELAQYVSELRDYYEWE